MKRLQTSLVIGLCCAFSGPASARTYKTAAPASAYFGPKPINYTSFVGSYGKAGHVTSAADAVRILAAAAHGGGSGGGLPARRGAPPTQRENDRHRNDTIRSGAIRAVVGILSGKQALLFSRSRGLIQRKGQPATLEQQAAFLLKLEAVRQQVYRAVYQANSTQRTRLGAGHFAIVPSEARAKAAADLVVAHLDGYFNQSGSPRLRPWISSTYGSAGREIDMRLPEKGVRKLLDEQIANLTGALTSTQLGILGDLIDRL